MRFKPLKTLDLILVEGWSRGFGLFQHPVKRADDRKAGGSRRITGMARR
jgi:hypothetical protein